MSNNALTALVLAALDDSELKALEERVIELAQIGFKPVIVEELPEEGEENTLYLVPQQDPGEDPWYKEYMWLENQWELIGTTSVDFSDYYTSDDVDQILQNYYTKEEVDAETQILNNSIEELTEYVNSLQPLVCVYPKDGGQVVDINPNDTNGFSVTLNDEEILSFFNEHANDNVMLIIRCASNRFIAIPGATKSTNITGVILPNAAEYRLSFRNITMTKTKSGGKITSVVFASGNYRYSEVYSTATTAELANYFTKNEINNLLGNYYTQSQIDNIINQVNNDISNLSGDITNIENDISNMGDEITNIENNLSADVSALEAEIATKARKDKFFDGVSEDWDEFTEEQKVYKLVSAVEDYVTLDISETYSINAALGADPQEEIISDMYEEEIVDLTNEIIGGNGNE